jgi:hypothetical protein
LYLSGPQVVALITRGSVTDFAPIFAALIEASNVLMHDEHAVAPFEAALF